MKVFLGGTVNGSKWRDYMMPKLEIDYFNPVVEDWDEAAYIRELHEREFCDYCLYVLTPKMTGYYSLAEVVDDSFKRPDRTLYCFIEKDEEERFSKRQLKAFEALGNKVEENGGLWFKSIDEIVTFLNSSKNLVSVPKSQEAEFYDVFISYGRRHSKDFATVLHDRMAAMKYNVWFDQNNIPLGVDFQEQINDGITKSHNFIFIISPHSVRSEYCLKEIVLAVKLNKRIIPLLHVEPKDDWDKMHPTIGKLNWIYFQEGVNDFEQSYKGLIELTESHKDYIETHTSILNRALEWNAKLRPIALLISAPRVPEAKAWLLKEFHNTQPPCLPAGIHAEFICESIEYAEESLTDVFLCYDEEETQLPLKIYFALMRKAITTWTKDDVKPGENYHESAKNGIERNINFVFLLSNKTIKNKQCISELEYALQLNKRIIPIEIEAVDNSLTPEIIKGLYILDGKTHTDESFTDTMSKLVQVLHKDNDYLKLHRDLLMKALKWQRNDKPDNLLLFGFDLIRAQEWFKKNEKRKGYVPLKLHTEFIQKSDISRSTVFLSFDKEESLTFAEKIGNQLIEYGFNVWFDASRVQEEQDFEQHKEGILKADNYLFVISPKSVKSEKCLSELDFANSLSKRIIPLSYMAIEQEFAPKYLSFNEENTIRFVDNKDNYDRSFDKLIERMEQNTDYVKKHTELLIKSWTWNERNRSINMLPTDAKRKAFHHWLMSVHHIKNFINPPSLLHCEFFSEAKKFSKINTNDVFVLYDDGDGEKYKSLYYQMLVMGLTVWTNQGERKESETMFEDAVILSSKIVVIIPADASLNPLSEQFVKYAKSLKKSIIGITTKAGSEVPEILSNVPIVDLSDYYGDPTVAANHPDKRFVPLITELNKENAFHLERKMLLFEALSWERLKRIQSMQISGKKLEYTLEWLKENEEYIPDIVKDYITECKSKEESISHEVFVSYSKKNSDFALNLNHHLRIHGKPTWFDQHYIKKQSEYEDIILEGIDNSINVLFIFSDDFFDDPNCVKELEHVMKQNKRIIPVMYSPVTANKFPPQLSTANTINFIPEESQFRIAFAELLRTLETDREHVQNHAKWLKKAHEWNKNDQRDELLLRGVEFELAMKWMETAIAEKKSPRVNMMHEEYINKSNKAILAALRREKNVRLFRGIASVIMALLMVVAIIFGFVASKKSAEADRQRQATEKQKIRAENLAHFADSVMKDAVKKGYEAVRQKENAEIKAREAREAKERAERLRVKAEVEKKNAIEAQLRAMAEMERAERLRKEADTQRTKAEVALRDAKEQKEKADSLFMLAEAQALAAKALKLLNDGKKDVAVALALHSYYMNIEKQGPKQVNEIYETLFSSLLKEDKNAKKYTIAQQHKYGVKNISNVGTTDKMISAGEDGKFIIWKLTNNKLENIRELVFMTKIITVAYDGADLLYISEIGGGQKLYNLSSSKPIEISKFNNKSARVIDSKFVDYKGKKLLIVSDNKAISIYSPDDNYTSAKVINMGNTTEILCSNTGVIDNQLFVYAIDANNKLSGWHTNQNYDNLKLTDSLKLRSAATQITVSNNGKFIAIGSYSGRIDVYHRSNFLPVDQPLLGHNSPITSLVFSPDSKQLASTSYDHTARLWLFENNENETGITLRHESWVLSAAYSKDGNMLITGDYAGKLHLWYTKTNLLVEKLCAEGNYKITREEFKEYSKADVKYIKTKGNNCVDFE